MVAWSTTVKQIGGRCANNKQQENEKYDVKK